jgi:hypothetical protein
MAPHKIFRLSIHRHSGLKSKCERHAGDLGRGVGLATICEWGWQSFTITSEKQQLFNKNINRKM